MWMARVIEPGLVTQTDRVDHERVALIPANRVAHPGNVRVLGMFPIHRDGPPNARELIEDVYYIGSLNHRKFPWVHPNAGNAWRVAVPLNWIVGVLEGLFGPKRRPGLLPFRRCPGSHGSQFRLLAVRVGGIPCVYPYAVWSGGPKSGQIGCVRRRMRLFGFCRFGPRGGLRGQRRREDQHGHETIRQTHEAISHLATPR